MDCQFSINSAVTEVSSVRGPHLDSPNKLFAGLFYMRQQGDTSTGGELDFYRLKNGRWPRPKLSRIAMDHLEHVDRISYSANTPRPVLEFAVEHSWGHTAFYDELCAPLYEPAGRVLCRPVR